MFEEQNVEASHLGPNHDDETLALDRQRKPLLSSHRRGSPLDDSHCCFLRTIDNEPPHALYETALALYDPRLPSTASREISSAEDQQITSTAIDPITISI